MIAATVPRLMGCTITTMALMSAKGAYLSGRRRLIKVVKGAWKPMIVELAAKVSACRGLARTPAEPCERTIVGRSPSGNPASGAAVARYMKWYKYGTPMAELSLENQIVTFMDRRRAQPSNLRRRQGLTRPSQMLARATAPAAMAREGAPGGGHAQAPALALGPTLDRRLAHERMPAAQIQDGLRVARLVRPAAHKTRRPATQPAYRAGHSLRPVARRCRALK